MRRKKNKKARALIVKNTTESHDILQGKNVVLFDPQRIL